MSLRAFYSNLRCWALVLLVLGLAISSAAGSTPPLPPRPAADRIDAVVGQPIVLRLIVEREHDLRDGLTIRLDDGRTIACPVYWVGSVPAKISRPLWTRPPMRTTAIGARTALLTDIQARPRGGWYTLIAIPLDAVGQGIWIENQRYDLNWLPDPQRAQLESQGRDIESFFAPAHADEILRLDPVQTAIEQFAQSPMTRWRARILLDGLNPSAQFTPLDAPRPEGYLTDLHDEIVNTDPSEAFLEALAHQSEIRWQIILGRIWLIDETLAHRLKHTLTRVVRFDETILPVWPSNQFALDELAHDLLSPWVDDQLRVRRARVWLDTLPRAITWVVDDLGAYHPETEKFTPTVGIVSLPPEHGNTLVRLDAPGAQTTLTTVDDTAMHTLAITTPPAEFIVGQTTTPTHQLRIRLGHAEMTRTAIAAPIHARPPGIRIGPLHRDWTMNALMEPNPSAVAPLPITRATAGLLHRTAPPDEPDARIGWTVYIECASQDPTNPRDSITLWVGPFTHPLAVWTIDAAGTTTRIAGSLANIPLPKVQVALLDDRWTAQIELPRESVADNLLLALGVERTDADGVHSAWPRRMIPGQSEPARLVIDVSSWDGFRQSPGGS